MTFNACFTELMDFKRFEYAEHTRLDKIYKYEKHIKPLIGAMTLDSLSYPILQSVLNSMLKNGYAAKTVAHIRDIIRTVFSHAMRCEYTAKNPSLYLEVKQIDNRCFLKLSKSQCLDFIASVRSESSLYHKALFLLLLHGRRVNEVRCLEWSWIDSDTKTLSIPAQFSKDRTVHSYSLSDELIALLKQLPRISKLVFVNPDTGNKFVDIRRAFKRILARAGIEKADMRIHDIRHLVGTTAINAGMSLEDVKYTLGHKNVSTTMRYVTQDTTRSRKVIGLIFGNG